MAALLVFLRISSGWVLRSISGWSYTRPLSEAARGRAVRQTRFQLERFDAVRFSIVEL